MSIIYLHKEPVLDRNKCLFGNELSFRKTNASPIGLRWPSLSVDEEVASTISSEGGFQRLTRNNRTFLLLDVSAMKADVLALLPKNSILQVPEKDILDKEVLLKAAMLKKLTYQIAIDYTPSGHGLLPAHGIADFVRISALSVPVGQVAALLKGLRGKLIVRGVEDGESFTGYRDAGLELFQGPFFMRPSGEGSPSVSSDQQVLLQLFNDLRANKDVEIIERAFKNSPELAYGLLRLMNSAFFHVGRKINSIGDAITLLGYENLQKWVVLLLFEVDHRDSQSYPLIEKALVRGRLMESLAKKTERTLADSAFITGMLSFMNTLFNMEADEVTQKLNLAQAIQDALTERKGVLGMLLALAEKADRQEYDDMDGEAKALGLSPEDVLWAETNAVMDAGNVFES